MKKKIITIMISITLLFSTPAMASRIIFEQYSENCIPNEEIALQLADIIIRVIYPDIDFDKYYPT